MERGYIQILFLLLILMPAIFFLLTQQNTLKIIQPAHRSMSPGQVWQQLIPIFGLIWQFIVVSRIADAISRELAAQTTFSFEANHRETQLSASNEKPTYSIGLAYCILMCCSIIPILRMVTSIPGMVCWIVYWVQLAGYKNKIAMHHPFTSPPSLP